MSLTHTHTRTITRSGGVSESASKSVVFESETVIDINIDQNTTDQLVALAIDQSQMKSLYIESDQDLTIETNDGSSPDDTISVKADQAIVWMENDSTANPITADVDGIYVTVGAVGAGGANLKIYVGVDPTV